MDSENLIVWELPAISTPPRTRRPRRPNGRRDSVDDGAESDDSMPSLQTVSESENSEDQFGEEEDDNDYDDEEESDDDLPPLGLDQNPSLPRRPPTTDEERLDPPPYAGNVSSHFGFSNVQQYAAAHVSNSTTHFFSSHAHGRS